ncbi:hypothetical protein [Flavobacterium sp. SLB02]|uniref:hypothetical protein n=1 Tax=Flavobacterium sp. SLB02 TaxID=2665645 RepID=UPI0012A810AC|nr:hypothetical protein [Flavobacterium sp. SLB02]QGK76712.1 hypothetical protein GIY83_22350 [Flavobacterium sp. SLB02]
MKKITFLIFIVIGTICYSKYKIELNINPNDSLKIIKKVIKNYENGVLQNEEVVKYTYENDLVSKIVTTTDNNIITNETTIKYENGKLKEMYNIFPFAKIKKGNKIMTQMESIINVVYNYENDLIKNAIGYQNDKITHVDNFIYNADKQLVKKQTKTEGISNRETKYTYNKEGNLLKEKESESNEYYKYDDKRNPFDLVFPQAYLKIYQISKNNIKSCNWNSNSYTYEYEYNSDNYPIKIIKKNGRKIENETIIEYSKV